MTQLPSRDAKSSVRLFIAISLLLAILVAQKCALAQFGLSTDAAPQPGSAVSPGANTTAVDGGQGGGANADFETLIELIQSTVATDTWAENGGGTADMRPFAVGGVLVDADGTLRRVQFDSQSNTLDLLRDQPRSSSTDADDPRRSAHLRYVSLSRLEQEIARRQHQQLPLEESMLTLAGLRRVTYVFLYPEQGDVVLAGPAADWYVGPGGLILSTTDDQPVVRLDDLLVLLRREFRSPGSQFGCSITPRQESLARTQAFIDRSSQRPLQPGQRKRWLEQLRSTLGQQDIEVFGVDPASRVARVLVEADYHMKLIGMGLEEGVVGVKSYLDTVRMKRGATSLPMAVLRWWFSMNYQAMRTNADKSAWELVGQGAQVLSENEFLTQQGQRIHTGQSDELTAQFAHGFTANFALLCQKYPLYAELRNIFDLALASALIRSAVVTQQVAWQPSLLVDDQRLQLPQANVPRQVDTVINHRVVNRRNIVVGVSGGVLAAPSDILNESRRIDDYGAIASDRRAAPSDLAAGKWWWDFEGAVAR